MKTTTFFAAVALAFTVPTSLVGAGKVLDLGRIEIKGSPRGPETQIIETGKIESSTITHLLLRQLRELEAELLMAPPDQSPDKGGKP